MRLPPEEFDSVYRAMLATLDSETVWRELHRLADPHEPVVLCWERPGLPCHRRHVAEWLQEMLGHEVDELV